MTVHVGIALYLIKGSRTFNIPSYFHWALVASAANSWASQPVLALELRKQPDGAFAQSFQRCDISHSSAFRGVVHLFTTSNYTVDSFQTLIQTNFPAYDSGWRFPGRYGPQGWTCATWILRILRHLREEGTWVSPRDFELTYTRILNFGSELLERTNNTEYQGAVRVITFQLGTRSPFVVS